jgi:hypothetical protein
LVGTNIPVDAGVDNALVNRGLGTAAEGNSLRSAMLNAVRAAERQPVTPRAPTKEARLQDDLAALAEASRTVPSAPVAQEAQPATPSFLFPRPRSFTDALTQVSIPQMVTEDRLAEDLAALEQAQSLAPGNRSDEWAQLPAAVGERLIDAANYNTPFRQTFSPMFPWNWWDAAQGGQSQVADILPEAPPSYGSLTERIKGDEAALQKALREGRIKREFVKDAGGVRYPRIFTRQTPAERFAYVMEQASRR